MSLAAIWHELRHSLVCWKAWGGLGRRPTRSTWLLRSRCSVTSHRILPRCSDSDMPIRLKVRFFCSFFLLAIVTFSLSSRCSFTLHRCDWWNGPMDSYTKRWVSLGVLFTHFFPFHSSNDECRFRPPLAPLSRLDVRFWLLSRVPLWHEWPSDFLGFSFCIWRSIHAHWLLSHRRFVARVASLCRVYILVVTSIL